MPRLRSARMVMLWIVENRRHNRSPYTDKFSLFIPSAWFNMTEPWRPRYTFLFVLYAIRLSRSTSRMQGGLVVARRPRAAIAPFDDAARPSSDRACYPAVDWRPPPFI